MSYNGQKILVTGSSGFVARHLIASLSKKGANILGLSRTLSQNSGNFCRTVNVDLTNSNQLLDVVLEFDPDCVIHLASNKFRGKIDAGFQIVYQDNVSMSLNLIQACQNLCRLKRFIFLGSCDEYGYSNDPFDETQCEYPNSVYGLSKLAITKILIWLYNTKRFPAVILRPSIIYGPNQGSDMFLPALIQSLREKRNFLMSPGNQYRDYVFIDDMINAIEKAILVEKIICGQIINVAYGESIKLSELVKIVSDQFNNRAIQLIKIGAVPYRDGENLHYAVNIERAREILGWQPEICLKAGLKMTIQGR